MYLCIHSFGHKLKELLFIYYELIRCLRALSFLLLLCKSSVSPEVPMCFIIIGSPPALAPRPSNLG